ncbi:MAG: CPBP family intramembrane glutamic endopeptidase [Maribacter dokdonensis]|uniref:CPBP family intramembrane glutamic endopeptidase n=1 Tax=Maribacter dokdonensis TaxID=320912 RepID=UPI003298406A
MTKSTLPFTLGIIIIAIIGIIFQIPFDKVITESHFSNFQIEYLVLSVKMSSIFFLSLILINNLKEKALSGLDSSYKWSFKFINLIPFYLFLLGISTFIDKDLSLVEINNLLLLLLACLMVGFAEEYIFRGFLQPLFIKKYISHKNGIFLGILFPALFFGSSHLLNLTVNDNIPQVIGQSIYAVFIGFFFGVVLLKTNKLIPLAITHGLINFFFLFNSLPNLNSTTDINSETRIEATLTEQITISIIPLFIFLPLFIIGLILLRKINKEQIQEKINL